MKRTKLFAAIVVGMLAALLALAACGSSNNSELDADTAAGPMQYSISSSWTANSEQGSSPLPNVYSNYYQKDGDEEFYVVVAVYNMAEAEPPTTAQSPEEQAKGTYEAKSGYEDMTFTQEEVESLSVAGASVKIYKEESTTADDTFTEYVAYIQSQPDIEAFIASNDKDALDAIIQTISFE